MEEQMSLFDMGGLTDDGAMRDPVSGNEVPPGSMASEVRDDVPAMLSEGEYIVPADVVRFFGVKFFEDLRSQAKSGLMDMERNGRIGGEPVDALEEELSPEEMQMLAEISGMYKGGMVKGYQEGGVVDQTFAPIPNYGTPGFSTFQPAQAVAPVAPVQTQNVTLYGPNGEVTTLTLPTDQERYNQLLGQGYTTQPRSLPQIPQAQTDSGDSEDDFVFSGEGTENRPLRPEMFDALNADPLAFGQSMLERNDFTRMAGGLGSAALGPLGGLAAGAISAGITANNVAQARAAVQVARSRGLDTTELEANIDRYVSNLPNAARMMANSVSGDRIVERFNSQLEQGGITAPAAQPTPVQTPAPTQAPQRSFGTFTPQGTVQGSSGQAARPGPRPAPTPAAPASDAGLSRAQGMTSIEKAAGRDYASEGSRRDTSWSGGQVAEKQTAPSRTTTAEEKRASAERAAERQGVSLATRGRATGGLVEKPKKSLAKKK